MTPNENGIIMSSSNGTHGRRPRHLRGYVVLVFGRGVRTKVYMTLDGAENCVSRARDRGQRVEMHLVRLVFERTIGGAPWTA